MKKIISIFLIISMLMLGGCVKKKAVSTKEVRNYIVYNIGKIPKDFMLLKNNELRSQDLLQSLFEGLVCTNKEGKIIPGIASEWKISKDKLSYTFKIRYNAKWSNGDAITAKDVAEFFKEILGLKENNYKKQLYCIFGAKDYAENKSSFDKVAINAKDDATLEIRLNYPCSYFLNILSQPMYSIRKNFENLGKWESEYSNIIYSGPFGIEKVSENGEIYLNKNKMYWDEYNVKSEKILIKNEESSEFALADYKWDEVDIILNPPMNEVGETIQHNEVETFETSKCMGIGFNLKSNNIIKNSDFRKCINYAIDRENISKKVLGKECESFIKIDNKTNKALFNKNKDVNKAKDLLKKTGYKGERIKIVYLDKIQNNKEIIEEVKKSLEDIKINVSIEECDLDTFNKAIDNKDYDILISNYIVEPNYPLNFLEKWTTNSKENKYGYANWNYDNSVMNSKIEAEENKIKSSIISAQNILYEDMPFIPICTIKNTICKKDYIDGLEINNKGNVILKKVYIKDKGIKDIQE